MPIATKSHPILARSQQQRSLEAVAIVSVLQREPPSVEGWSVSRLKAQQSPARGYHELTKGDDYYTLIGMWTQLLKPPMQTLHFDKSLL